LGESSLEITSSTQSKKHQSEILELAILLCQNQAYPTREQMKNKLALSSRRGESNEDTLCLEW
jgi:hypothetical protein